MVKVSLKSKVTIDVNSGNFYSATDCLKSLGYSRLDEKGKSYKGTHTLFEKDGKIYAFVTANHFNTYFYDITLAVVE